MVCADTQYPFLLITLDALFVTCTDNDAGATYDSIEGRFRIIKKEAASLKAEIDNGARPEAPTRGAVSMNTTPKKPKSASNTPKKVKVVGGRVDKNKGTPSKKRGTAIKGMKVEPDSRYDCQTFVLSSGFTNARPQLHQLYGSPQHPRRRRVRRRRRRRTYVPG